MAEQTFDLNQITPEAFAQLVAAATDDQIVEAMRGVGLDTALDRIFEGMRERFAPDKAKGVNDVIQWVVTDQGNEHPYTATIHDGVCETARGRADKATVTLTTDLVSFIRLISGQAHGPQLFMGGKLQISGNLMFATRVETFFDRPQT
jgi:putative sterol carrier protein